MIDGVRWVLFDAVGTLIYADPPVAEVYQAAGRKFGSRLEVNEIQQRFRLAWAAEAEAGSGLTRPATSEFAELARWRRIVAAVFSDVPTESMGRLFQSLWLHFASPQSWRLYGDVEPALRQLKQRDYRLGIASNFDGRLLRIVQSLGGPAACERVFVSSQLGFAKPDQRFFTAVEQELDSRPAEILLVGDDRVADICGGQAAGWKTAWLQRDSRPGEPHIRSLPEILNA